MLDVQETLAFANDLRIPVVTRGAGNADLKRVFDPKGILNPGKVLTDAPLRAEGLS